MPFPEAPNPHVRSVLVRCPKHSWHKTRCHSLATPSLLASFLLPPSSFLLPPSSFLLPPSSFLLPPSSFLLPPSSSLHPPSSFLLASSLHPPSSFLLASSLLPASCFLLPPSSFLLPASRGGKRRIRGCFCLLYGANFRDTTLAAPLFSTSAAGRNLRSKWMGCRPRRAELGASRTSG
jgi:hypothetical protein